MNLRSTDLVGRVEERARIEAAIDDNRGLLLSGPAGVGKTRLLHEARDALQRRGFDVIEIIGAQATADIPLAPLLGLVDLKQEGDLARLVLLALTLRSRDGQVAMLIDDIQRLDEGSASLIHRVAVSELAIVFATHRSTDPLTNAAESLWKDGYLDRISIDPISQFEQQELASLMVGELDSPTQEWLWDIAAGHPLFLRELLVDAVTNSRISQSDLGASIARPEGLPPRLFEMVGKNVYALDPKSRRALELVAVGGAVDVSVVTKLGGDAAVRRLLDDGLCVLRRNELFTSHPLFAETATARMTPGALRNTKIALADGIDSAAGNNMQSVLLRISAGEPVDDEPLRAAFEQAVFTRQPQLMQQTGAVLFDQTGDPLAAAQAAMGYAMIRAWDDSDHYFNKAVDAASADQLDEVYLIWLTAAFEYRTDPAEAMALADYVVANTQGPANQVARALQYRVRMFFEPLAPILNDRAEMLKEDLDPRAESAIRLDQATVGWRMLRVPLVHSMLGSYDASGADVLGQIRIQQVYLCASAWSDGIRRTLAKRAEIQHSLGALGGADAEILLHVAGQQANAYGLNVGEAIRHYEAIEPLEPRASDGRVRGILDGEHALVSTRLRDFDEPASQFVNVVENADPSVYALSGAQLYLSASRAARRDNERGFESLRQKALQVARWRGDLITELFALRDEYAFGDPATEPTLARLKEIANTAGPGLAQLYADEAAAHLARDGEWLVRLSVSAEEYGAQGLAWDMTAAAQRLFHAAGLGSAALKAERRSHRLAALDPRAKSPLHQLMEPILTEREREVAALVVDGMTNPEVADTLYLSPRTVGRHLERIYRKLGISSRSDLGELVPSGSD